MTRIKIVLVAAARPNFMKVAPIIKELKKFPDKFNSILVHTGQHYDYAMSRAFFEQLNIPAPNIDLEVGSGTHAEQSGKVMIKFEQFLIKERPDIVIVVGDVNSTMACAIAAKKMKILVAHVEAGLRSFDRNMPEEINRLLTDSIADILYTPSEDADKQLIKEGIEQKKIIHVGNIMIDTLHTQKSIADASRYYEKLGLNKSLYALVTLHRPGNVDVKETFTRIMDVLLEVSKTTTIIFPMHPRTRKLIQSYNMAAMLSFDKIIPSCINAINPIGYNEMLNLTLNARLVLTDSGGLQEETTALGIPCLTLRENTERPVTVTVGSNVIVGTDPQLILTTYEQIMSGVYKQSSVPRYWDGRTAARIVQHLDKYFSNGRNQ
ncbi:MAG: UDP-N-acetylglucosamine 2-epimerase (non-hydrolyzing) [Candidatus Margulisiibacteriota bacterium]|nr:MAG: UDP-N-acetylglucosamine 2-epimerase [Candidatus Margulisbacteria bacterium GWD2_39_127]OGI04786.1 MAG: UDP-N-acetylglucosamine 2-epimerase [Candidatus Margulisbacteria bacterium GWF2_38_17]OGI05731.1 MAG: UDP-N-acetylglucosamine 2-epimerase [Candidatus Margulisbacteria bacterium GWE2_39_32]PZM83666.1 MAG: UDP-N-acetylglucosamine 2-epimerase (non-hydrolyzing) [Candidatus Margulisiibacteriota bacterium]HAR62084.1 UDP-N-acetylglucosamine 2-epimerase (non-hydrolyzing) [Candidatus Margulisii